MDADAPEPVRELAGRLGEVARAAGYSGVRDLAAGTRVGKSTVSDVLTGKRVPTWETLKALLLGCDAAPNRDWADAHKAAGDALEAAKHAARGGGDPVRAQPVPSRPAGPGTFSIRPPYGELPPRVRGRDELLDLLETRLSQGDGRPQILHGMGGCGKTTLALHLARRARDRGYRVYWVSASSPDRLVTGMREVARESGAAPDEIEAAWAGRISATDLVWRELDGAEHPWLLVVDNVDEPSWLAAESGAPGDGTGWLRSSRAGMTVVTTRVGSPGIWGHEADTHRVGVLVPADGRDVLLDLAGEAGDPDEAMVLAQRLDGLPLALKLAGSYLARSARGAGLLRHRDGRPGGRVRGFTAYAEALGEAGAGFLDQGGTWRGDDAGTEQFHRRLIGRTWELSLDLLEEQRLPEARSLMRLLSCCALTPFPVGLLDIDPLPLPGATARGADAERVDRAIEALIDLGLLDVVDIGSGGSSDGHDPIPCLASHRLVLEANALRLAEGPAEDRTAVWRAAAEILERGAARAPEQPGNWLWWRLLFPHVVAALAAAPGGDEDAVLLPLLRVGLGGFAFKVFAGAEADQELAGLLERRAAFLPPDHPLRLSIRHRAVLADRNRALRGEEQLRELEHIVTRQAQTLGADSPETLITRFDLAGHRFSLGMLSEAELVTELHAIRLLRSRVLGPHDPYTLLTQRALSQLTTARGYDEEHLGEFERLLAEQTAQLGADHIETLITRHDVATARRSCRPEEDAQVEAELRELLTDCRRALGATDPYTLLVHGTLAHLIAERGHGESGADEEYRQLIEHTRSRSASDHHFLPLQDRHHMAHALDAAQRWAEAEMEYRSVLQDLERAGAQEYELYWNMTSCLAKNLVHQGRRDDALAEYEGALSSLDGRGPVPAPVLTSALRLRHERADLLSKGGRREEAEREIRAVLAIRLESVDGMDSVVLSERHCLAHLFEKQQRHTEAIDELRQVADAYADVLGPADKQSREAALCLARLTRLHGDRAEALRLYETVLAGESAEYGPDHPEALMTAFRRDQCRLGLGLLRREEAVVAFEHTLDALTSRVGEDHEWVTTVREVLAAAQADG
ncbi:AAA family ATPase [Kitasatospora sp. NPDC006786]|uniref:AAA family ATPase n=1 Tax=unclassified Kitasatospora TaxID=2633591 RepID=UPI0033EBB74C